MAKLCERDHVERSERSAAEQVEEEEVDDPEPVEEEVVAENSKTPAEDLAETVAAKAVPEVRKSVRPKKAPRKYQPPHFKKSETAEAIGIASAMSKAQQVHFTMQQNYSHLVTFVCSYLYAEKA
jgi:hypothetical protein